jgi:hypothetical protein
MKCSYPGTTTGVLGTLNDWTCVQFVGTLRWATVSFQLTSFSELTGPGDRSHPQLQSHCLDVTVGGHTHSLGLPHRRFVTVCCELYLNSNRHL